MEAQVTWDLGKTLGFHVCDERSMFVTLSKVREVLDFVLPKRRGDSHIVTQAN